MNWNHLHSSAGVGVVLLRNTGLEGKLDAMGDWGREIMGDAMKYEGGANYRKGIIKNVYDTGAPKGTHNSVAGIYVVS